MPKINLGRKKKPRRKTESKASYQHIYQNKRWKRIRAARVRLNPLCEICESFGITRQVEEVNHIIPFMLGSDQEEVENLAFDLENTESLCKYHHKLVDNSFNI